MDVEPFSLPLTRPLATASGRIEKREGFVVRLAVDGTTGVGEATPLAGWTESLSDCRATLEAVVDPETALSGGTLEDRPAARHAVASALADARARVAGEPLYRWLGAGNGTEECVESVPVNATVGDGTADETAASARRAVASGYGAVKVKVGARPVEEDVARLRAVRDACPGVELRGDANGAWTREEARRAFDALADLDVAYVEQPLAPDDVEGHAALRGGAVDVAIDESLGEYGPEAILDEAAADVLVCKPMVLGGADRVRDVARRARDGGVRSVVTTTVDGALARATAVHVAASLPDLPACGLATGDRLARDLLVPDPAPVADGEATVPQEPGIAGTTAYHDGSDT